jgi:hypothetical protein
LLRRRYHYFLPVRALLPGGEAMPCGDEASWEVFTDRLKAVTRRFVGQVGEREARRTERHEEVLCECE